jgi:hypothetical protein
MMRLSGRRAAFAAAIASVLAVIGVALWVIGSPGEERLRRLDDRRVGHLEAIAAAVDRHFESKRQLPATLEELARLDRSFDPVTDPVSGQPYEYRVLGERRYQLCAEFQHRSREEPQAAWPVSLHFWKHDAARQCFEVEPQAIRR